MSARSIFFLAALLLTTAVSRGAEAGARRNFLFILADDLRADAIGCAGNRHVKTPNIDSLAARGVHFANCFVTTSICSPGRAAVLTGRYGSTNGVLKLDKGIKPDQPTWAQVLQGAGYRTAVVGKWHLANKPEALGFEQAAFFRSNGAYYSRKIDQEGKAGVAEGHIEDWCVERSTEIMRQAVRDKKPFALFHCTQLPHLDHRHRWDARPKTLEQFDAALMPLPASWVDDLSEKPPFLKSSRSRSHAVTAYGYDKAENVKNHVREYYAVVSDLDAALGKLLKNLELLNLGESTYVVFLSDNGWLLGEHGLTSKVLAYEESIRVPLIIAGPGINSRTRKELVLNVDLAPTLLELAEVPVKDTFHGRSLVELLKPSALAQGLAWRASILYEATESELGCRPAEAVRTASAKYIRTLKPDGAGQVEFEELYDLSRDPGELKNLAKDPEHQRLLRDLRTELELLRAQINNNPRPAQ